jgi:hypothetical protein
VSYEEDFYINKRLSTLRTERNVFLFVGCIMGIGLTLVSQGLWLWVMGVI